MYDQHPFELPSWDVLRALDRAHEQGFRRFWALFVTTSTILNIAVMLQLRW